MTQPLITIDFGKKVEALPVEEDGDRPIEEMLQSDKRSVRTTRTFHGFEKSSYVLRVAGAKVVATVTCRAPDGNFETEIVLDEKQSSLSAVELLRSLHDTALDAY